MIKKALIYISISVMAVFLVACGATSKMDKSSKNEKNQTESKQKKKVGKQTNYQKIKGEKCHLLCDESRSRFWINSCVD